MSSHNEKIQVSLLVRCHFKMGFECFKVTLCLSMTPTGSVGGALYASSLDGGEWSVHAIAASLGEKFLSRCPLCK